MKITVRLAAVPGYERDVDGEIVDIAPHLANVATFVVHKNPFSDGSWQITNVESGHRIGSPYHYSKGNAIKEATAYLAAKTEKQVLNAYRKVGVK